MATLNKVFPGSPQEIDQIVARYSKPCELFSSCNLPKLLKDYVDNVCATTNADPMAVTSSLVCLISGFLKKSVYIPQDDYRSDPREVYFERLHVNTYQLCVLPSGLFKTTAQKRAMVIGQSKVSENNKRIQKIDDQLNKLQIKGNGKSDSAIDEMARLKKQRDAIMCQSPFLSQRSTAEGLLDVQLSQGRSGTIFLSEMGTWLSGLQKKYNNDLKSMFTELYDVLENYESTTKGGGTIRLERPFITICGLSTIDWIKQMICQADVYSGFFARFLIFAPPGRPDFPPAMPARRQTLNTRVEDKLKSLLFNDIPQDRPYMLSQSAYTLFNQVHRRLYSIWQHFPDNTQRLLEPFIKRWSPAILKLAMIMQFTLNSRTNEISCEAINCAKEIVEYAIHSTFYLFQTELGESPHQAKCTKVLKYLARRKEKGKKTFWRDILQSKVLPGGRADYAFILKELAASNRVEFAQDIFSDEGDDRWGIRLVTDADTEERENSENDFIQGEVINF